MAGLCSFGPVSGGAAAARHCGSACDRVSLMGSQREVTAYKLSL